uniref:Uncharacterized protein n=1 Tax=Oryza meridionalis TaxID=40149 RepID=A0A0E0C2M7_9ORYZ
MRRQSTRGRSTGSGGSEESEAPAAAVHAGRIFSEDAAARWQNMRGGGGEAKSSRVEEERSTPLESLLWYSSFVRVLVEICYGVTRFLHCIPTSKPPKLPHEELPLEMKKDITIGMNLLERSYRSTHSLSKSGKHPNRH